MENWRKLKIVWIDSLRMHCISYSIFVYVFIKCIWDFVFFILINLGNNVLSFDWFDSGLKIHKFFDMCFYINYQLPENQCPKFFFVSYWQRNIYQENQFPSPVYLISNPLSWITRFIHLTRFIINFLASDQIGLLCIKTIHKVW